MESRKKGQILYIIEATLEYFISIVVSGAYLAKVTTLIGMSQGLTGICTAFVSLGAGFQIFALFLARNSRPKRLVTLLHTINQACFGLIYLVPLVPVPAVAKHVFFVVFLLPENTPKRGQNKGENGTKNRQFSKSVQKNRSKSCFFCFLGVFGVFFGSKNG